MGPRSTCRAVLILHLSENLKRFEFTLSGLTEPGYCEWISGSDVGLSGIQETNVTSVNVTQETQSLAVRRIYFQHHHADKNFIKFCEISDTRELSSPVWSGQWTVDSCLCLL